MYFFFCFKNPDQPRRNNLTQILQKNPKNMPKTCQKHEDSYDDDDDDCKLP